MAFYDYDLTEHVKGKHELSKIEEMVGFSGLVYRLRIWRIAWVDKAMGWKVSAPTTPY